MIFGLPEFFGQARQIGRPSIFGIELTDPKPFLVFTAVVYGVLSLGVTWLRRGRIGRRLVAMRDSEAATACLGISLIETKVIVFSIAGAIAGIAGGILAFNVRFIATEQFPMIGGLAIILSLTVWGIGTASGPVVAGLSAAILATVSHDWAPGTWTRALELVGPGLAALVLVNHHRGQIPEISARSRCGPLGDRGAPRRGGDRRRDRHHDALPRLRRLPPRHRRLHRRRRRLRRRDRATGGVGAARGARRERGQADRGPSGGPTRRWPQPAATAPSPTQAADADIATFALGLAPMTPAEGRRLHKALQLPEVALPGGGS